jgi:hypothetical protein
MVFSTFRKILFCQRCAMRNAHRKVCTAHSQNTRHSVQECSVLPQTSARNGPVYHTGTSFCSWISYRHLSICTTSISLFSTYLTLYPCFTFKKYTGTSKFPFRALPQTTRIQQPQTTAPGQNSRSSVQESSALPRHCKTLPLQTTASNQSSILFNQSPGFSSKLWGSCHNRNKISCHSNLKTSCHSAVNIWQKIIFTSQAKEKSKVK